MDEKKPDLEDLIKNMDFSVAAAEVSKLVRAALTDEEIPTQKFTVTVEVPVPIVKTLQPFTDIFPNLTVQDLIQQMANENFNRRINQKASELAKPKAPVNSAENPFEAFKGLIDTDKITVGFDKMKELADQLQNIQGVIENANLGADPEDNK